MEIEKRIKKLEETVEKLKYELRKADEYLRKRYLEDWDAFEIEVD